MGGSSFGVPEAGVDVGRDHGGDLLGPAVEGDVPAGVGEGVQGLFLVVGDVGVRVPVEGADVDFEGDRDVDAVAVAAGVGGRRR